MLCMIIFECIKKPVKSDHVFGTNVDMGKPDVKLVIILGLVAQNYSHELLI